MQQSFCAYNCPICPQIFDVCTMTCSAPQIQQHLYPCLSRTLPCCHISWPHLPVKAPYRPIPYIPLEPLQSKCCKSQKSCKQKCSKPGKCCKSPKCYNLAMCAKAPKCSTSPKCCQIESVYNPKADHLKLKCYVPMENMTTYGESYVPMKYSREDPILPKDNVALCSGIISNKTTHRESYGKEYIDRRCCCCNGMSLSTCCV